MRVRDIPGYFTPTGRLVIPMLVLLLMLLLAGPWAYAAEGVALEGDGTAGIAWQPPTQNEDGSPLTDLAGFVIFWDGSARDSACGERPSGPVDEGCYSDHQSVPDAEATDATITLLVEGSATFYFAAAAYDVEGNFSRYSNEVAKTITVTVDDDMPPDTPTLVTVGLNLQGCAVVGRPDLTCTVKVE